MMDLKNGSVARVRAEYPDQHGLNGRTFSTEERDSKVIDQWRNSFNG
jgi:hypothetical protein